MDRRRRCARLARAYSTSVASLKTIQTSSSSSESTESASQILPSYLDPHYSILVLQTRNSSSGSSMTTKIPRQQRLLRCAAKWEDAQQSAAVGAQQCMHSVTHRKFRLFCDACTVNCQTVAWQSPAIPCGCHWHLVLFHLQYFQWINHDYLAQLATPAVSSTMSTHDSTSSTSRGHGSAAK